MKEFIEKLIDRLEEESNNAEAEMHILADSEYSLPCQYDRIDIEDCKSKTFCEAISIVNELAEEYKLSEMPIGWIPLGKKKPEYGQYVLASIPPKNTINGGHPIVIMEFREDNEPLFYKFVSAWMPLPIPYTEGE